MLHSLYSAFGRGRRPPGTVPIAPTILMYHRVADVAVDPWRLAVSPGWFERQMADLARHRSPMPVGELVDRLWRGTAPKDAVAVTFDDGYVDNLVHAKPILAEYGIPATLFLPTGSVGQPEEFWWDELAKLTLCWPGASTGSLHIAGTKVDWSFPEWEDSAGPVLREEAHLALWTALRATPATGVREAMKELRHAIGIAPRSSVDRLMTVTEIGTWLAGGLTEIAGHTVTHRPLTALSPDELIDEVTVSLARCSALSGKMVRGFAYPYGDTSPAVAEVLRSMGVEWACSTHAAALPKGRDLDLFDLPRIQIVAGELGPQWRDL